MTKLLQQLIQKKIVTAYITEKQKKYIHYFEVKSHYRASPSTIY